MPRDVFASKRFTVEDQERFAAVSGDRNPVHMDPVAARRTQAGAPVVHGIHTLLWSLDCLVRKHPDLPPLATITVRFHNLVYVGDAAEAVLTHCDASAVRAEVTADGVLAVRFSATFGGPRPPAKVYPDLPLLRPAGRIARAFPDAARAWSERRIAALVIGGLRGLGEPTSKLLAAGGARVIVTYAVGQADAERLQGDCVGLILVSVRLWANTVQTIVKRILLR